MKLVKRIKIALLLMRVLKLQGKADGNEYYNFEFSGVTNQIDFAKMRRNEYRHRTVKHFHCYLENDLGLTLDEFAEQIKIEEDLHR